MRREGEMAKHRVTKKTEFSQKERKKIIARDRGQCIFCMMGYPAAGANFLDLDIREIMHFIPRSQLGLGVERNGAVGCRFHHMQMDNGNKGLRAEMLGRFEAYLRGCYPDWDKGALVYKKYDFW